MSTTQYTKAVKIDQNTHDAIKEITRKWAFKIDSDVTNGKVMAEAIDFAAQFHPVFGNTPIASTEPSSSN